MISKSHHYLKFQYLWIASCQWEIYAHFWRFNEAGDSHYVKKNVIIYSDNFSFGTFYAKLSSQQRSFRFNWNIRNSNMLVASDFLFISLVVFNLFGNCEKYLYGYGKYELLRYKKRTLILGKIILKSFLSVCVFCLTRIIIYAFLLFIRNEKIIDFTVADISNYIFTSILSLFFISILQILVELKFSSFAGVITAFSYYIVSTILGGYFIEKEQYFPLLFLTTNFSMKNRTDLISADFVDLYILYLILAFAIIVCIFLCRKIIKQKDIF